MRIRFRNIIYFIFIVESFLPGCNDNSDKKITPNEGVDSSVMRSKNVIITKKVDTIPIKLRDQIIGTWLDLGKEELTVDISKQTFYYREHHELNNYLFDGDTIRIFYRGGTVSGKPYFINDTFLILASNDWGYKYIKFKE